jgi:hypothetical protein
VKRLTMQFVIGETDDPKTVADDVCDYVEVYLAEGTEVNVVVNDLTPEQVATWFSFEPEDDEEEVQV